jgi:hypothetical protein
MVGFFGFAFDANAGGNCCKADGHKVLTVLRMQTAARRARPRRINQRSRQFETPDRGLSVAMLQL